MDERKIAIVGSEWNGLASAVSQAMRERKALSCIPIVFHPIARNPMREIMSAAMASGMLADSFRAPGERKMFPTLKEEPSWTRHGRHQGAKEKARRLRQMNKGKKESRL